MMNYAPNQPAYYLPYARFKHACVIGGHKTIKKGEELPIAQDITVVSFNKDEVFVLSRDRFACNVIAVHLHDVELFVKIVYPQYKLGEIVIKKGTDHSFRIYQYTIIQGRVWYRDGWSVTTGCESGVYEDDLEYASAEQRESTMYNDSLVAAKNPNLYHAIMKADD